MRGDALDVAMIAVERELDVTAPQWERARDAARTELAMRMLKRKEHDLGAVELELSDLLDRISATRTRGLELMGEWHLWARLFERFAVNASRETNIHERADDSNCEGRPRREAGDTGHTRPTHDGGARNRRVA